MGSPLNLSIIAPCTGRKAWSGPSLDRAQLERFHAGRGSSSGGTGGSGGTGELPRFPATELYTGLGHVLLRRGIDAFREGVGAGSEGAGRLTLHIVSAGMGVVAEREMIPPYEATFTALQGRARREWAEKLGIPRKIAAVFAQPADLRLVLLGREYLEVAALPPITDGTPTIVLAAPSVAELVPAGALHVPLGQAHARRFHATLIALKGELVRRLLSDAALWSRADLGQLAAWRDADAFLELCEACGTGVASGARR
ncbi:hypothetical protein KKC22_09835 [Myxococcota bacterium]|nr:hypothetical protein [Myxococcota bacterium]